MEDLDGDTIREQAPLWGKTQAAIFLTAHKILFVQVLPERLEFLKGDRGKAAAQLEEIDPTVHAKAENETVDGENFGCEVDFIHAHGLSIIDTD